MWVRQLLMAVSVILIGAVPVCIPAQNQPSKASPSQTGAADGSYPGAVTPAPGHVLTRIETTDDLYEKVWQFYAKEFGFKAVKKEGTTSRKAEGVTYFVTNHAPFNPQHKQGPTWTDLLHPLGKGLFADRRAVSAR